MQVVLARRLLLKERILTILDQVTNSANRKAVIFLWDDESPIDFEYQAQVIRQLINGINDNL
jgi:hypothetical protein